MKKPSLSSRRPLRRKSLFAPTALCALLLLSCAKDDYARLYHSEPKAPSFTEEKIKALDHLGPTIVDKGVNFGVYSENASRMEVLFFDDPNSPRPTRQFPMTKFGAVWNVYVEGVGVGVNYGYIAWGPNWEYDPEWIPGSIKGFKADVDAFGNRFNPNKLLMDPYAKAFHRDHDWSKGSTASGPGRTDLTYAAAAKSVVVKSEYVWSESETKWRESRKDKDWVGHRFNDLILYEVHAKGFTASKASRVGHPGTFRGVAEKADYLKDLGITAVEFLPVFEKPLDGGYWGYQTLNFFAPELSYASRNELASVIDEFKYMVDELHKRDIEVILDVVYNHTGEGGLWREKIEPGPASSFDLNLYNLDPKEVAGLYSFRGLDNAAYYALSPDKQTYWNDTGVGNQTRNNHTPFKRLTMDSLRYYVEELHVDGFRFDLAPVLGAKDLAYSNWNAAESVLQDVVDDPVLNAYNTRIISEPWSLSGNFITQFPKSKTRDDHGWGEWNGGFRDWWRSFINDDAFKLNFENWCGGGDPKQCDGGFYLTGSKDFFAPSGRRPYHSVNFITVHDGFTMYDLVTYTQKVNKCGPLNPVCCEQPASPFCDRDSGESNNHSRDWGTTGTFLQPGNQTCGTTSCGPGYVCDSPEAPRCIPLGEPAKRQMMRNMFTAILISHGTPLILGGDEWMRTQLGNNNAYSTRSDNPFNWYDWGVWEVQPERQRMRDFVRDLIKFRKDHAYAFAPDTYEPNQPGSAAPFAWKSAQNTDAVDWGGKHLMLHYYDKVKGPELAILLNMENAEVTFTLPTGRQWQRVVDTQHYFDLEVGRRSVGVLDPNESGNVTLQNPAAITGATYGVAPRSFVILEAK